MPGFLRPGATITDWQNGVDHRVGHLWPLRMTLKLSKFLSWGAEVLGPRTEAAGVGDVMIEALLG
jgi:hypothetical protein